MEIGTQTGAAALPLLVQQGRRRNKSKLANRASTVAAAAAVGVLHVLNGN
jgi:hypothetical protein